VPAVIAEGVGLSATAQTDSRLSLRERVFKRTLIERCFRGAKADNPERSTAHTLLQGGIGAYRTITTLEKTRPPGHFAAVISTLLVAPMVGMLLMAPSYILAILGSLIRSFSADPNVSSERREY
jgi:hypothetical protein